MFKTDKVVFKQLSKMPLIRRIEVASSSDGTAVLSALTPTQLAELFPRYYLQQLPDVGGFRAATTAAAQERQAEASAGILDRLTKAEQGLEEYASQSYHSIKRKLGLEKEKLPELTPEQAAAFDKVRSGPLAIDSPEGKIFSGLDDKKLESIGITRIKDNTGHDVYQYAQPEVNRAEAESRLAQPTGGNLKSIIDEAAKKNGIDARIMYGMVAGESGHGNKYDTNFNAREESWGPFQMNRASWNPGLGTDFERETGKSVKDPSTLQAQADWIAKKIASKGDGARKWVASQWFGYKGDRDWNSSWGTMGAGKGEAGPSVKPEGTNGSYTDDQINKMMNQLRDEKNTARKQQLANLLADSGVSTATINSISQIKTSGVTGEHFGEGVQCVALSKHFAPQIGPASKWQFNEGTSGIVPGAVIATTSYKDGSGGHMASQMPDGKSHYHTGVALTKPDAEGNVLIFDQAKSHGSKITKINIYNYNGEKWGAVKGGEPSSKSMEAVNIALGRANDSEKVAITQSMRGEAPTKATSTGELKANVDVGPVPTKPVNQEGQPVVPPPAAPQPGAAPSDVPAPQSAPKVQAARYKFDEAVFEKAVRDKYGMLSSMYDRAGLVSEFKSKLPEGVTYEKGVLTIKDPNSPQIQTIRQDMEKEFGRDVINNMITQIKEEKKVEAKPKEQAPPPPEKKSADAATKVESKPQAPAAPATPPAPQPKVEAQPTQEPPKVPGASDGGSFNVGDRSVAISPIDKIDNKAVVDTRTQEPLFTVKSGENINVTPSQKVGGIAPAQDNIRNEIDSLRHEISSSFSDAGNKMPTMQMKQISSAGSDNPTFVGDLTRQTENQWNNSVFERAMNRTRMAETGDSLNNHFSHGNTNYG